MKRLINYLTTARKEYGLFRQKDATFACDTADGTVRNFERGRNISSKMLLYYISKCLKCKDTREETIRHLEEVQFNGSEETANDISE